MKTNHILYLSVAAAAVVGGMARADWDPTMGHKMHYPQLPDLGPSGVDVNATFRGSTTGGQFPFLKVLADDFRCSEAGPINDVHIWGSWLNNQVFTSARFKLSIHEDVPAGVDAPYSHPGALLWDHIFEPGTYTPRLYSEGPTETFWDPNTNQVLGDDNQVWQYNFVNIPNPYVQQEGKIYWLDVQAFVPAGVTAAFGWKTTNPLLTPHFNDDAVYADTNFFGGPPVPPLNGIGPIPWQELIYRPPLEFPGQSMDLAFVITPEPSGLAGIVIGGVLLRRRR